MRQLCAEAADRGTDAVVVSLGLDAAAEDPESPLRVTAAGYRAAGELIGSLGPVAVIQEGGYDLASLGELAVAALAGIQAGGASAESGSAAGGPASGGSAAGGLADGASPPRGTGSG